jgi:hypothetical protein
MAPSQIKSQIRYVGTVIAAHTRHPVTAYRVPQPGPGEVLIVRGRTQTTVYHACNECCKLREHARAIRRTVADYRGLIQCEFCREHRCCAEHREPQKTLDRYAVAQGEVIA